MNIRYRVEDMWCIPQVDAEYVARMEDVLDLYAEEPDRKRPVVCFDESPTQLIGEVRQPIKAKAGQLERYDYEYKRNGTANLFMMFAPLEGWRHVKVTDRHTAVDYAHVLKDLADTHFAKAEVITEHNARALIVPLDAIVQFAGVTKLFVILGDEKKARSINVETGKEGAGWVELLTPLPENAKVVTTGQSQLADETPILVKPPQGTDETKPTAPVAKTSGG